MRRFVIITSIVVATLLRESTAEACSWNCFIAHAIPRADATTVPANVPGFPVLPSRLVDGDASAGDITLANDKGETVPTTHEHDDVSGFELIRPTLPLPMGNYILQVPDCGQAAVLERKVSIVASSPLPTKSGVAHVVVSQEPVNVWTYSGACSVNVDAAVAHIEVDPDPELAPWVSMIDWVVLVDGESWSGPFDKSKDANIYPPQHYKPLTLFALCSDAGAPDFQRSLSEGPHHVSVTPRIVGAPPLPAIELDATLTCARGTSPSVSDGGVVALDGGVTDGGSVASSNTDSGCTTSEASSPLSSTGAVAVLAIAIAALSRRRSRHELSNRDSQ